MGHGFKRSNSKPTLYKKVQANNDLLLVCLYVDNIIYMGSSQSPVDEFKYGMMHTFEMMNLGRSSKEKVVAQKKNTEDLFKRFNMQNSKKATTPIQMRSCNWTMALEK